MSNTIINEENRGFKAISGILKRLERRPPNKPPDELLKRSLEVKPVASGWIDVDPSWGAEWWDSDRWDGQWPNLWEGQWSDSE
jgi:hypothetical protein